MLPPKCSKAKLMRGLVLIFGQLELFFLLWFVVTYHFKITKIKQNSTDKLYKELIQ